MPLLVRKISRAKWAQAINSGIPGDVSADAITSCLRTTNNELSVWTIATEDDLDEALLALVTNSKQESVAKIDYAIIDEAALLAAGLTLNSTPGDTVVAHLQNTHKDITELTYVRMGTVKDLLLPYVNGNPTSFRTKQQVKELIKNAVANNVLNKKDLHPGLLKDVGL